MRLARRKTLMTFAINALLLAGSAFIANISLPPDKVAGNLSKDTDRSFLTGHADAHALEQGYAHWQYKSYVIVKYAYSDTLNVTLAGYPFRQWSLHKRN